jgi:hypothetical protein
MLLLPGAVARRTRINFTAPGCLATWCDLALLFGPQVIATPLDGLRTVPRTSTWASLLLYSFCTTQHAFHRESRPGPFACSNVSISSIGGRRPMHHGTVAASDERLATTSCWVVRESADDSTFGADECCTRCCLKGRHATQFNTWTITYG